VDLIYYEKLNYLYLFAITDCCYLFCVSGVMKKEKKQSCSVLLYCIDIVVKVPGALPPSA
jgi:hypothetical protein